MRRDRAFRCSVLVIALALICLGLSGERAIVRGVPQPGTSTERQVAILTEGIAEPEPAVGIPLLWGVQWTDLGPAGIRVTVQADAVSHRPKRVGPFTFESFQEIVVTKARVRIADQLPLGDHGRMPNRVSKVLRQLQERLVSFYVMSQGGLQLKPEPAHVFTQTFLSGVVFDDLVVEVVGDNGVGRLHIETMSTAAEGHGESARGTSRGDGWPPPHHP